MRARTVGALCALPLVCFMVQSCSRDQSLGFGFEVDAGAPAPTTPSFTPPPPDGGPTDAATPPEEVRLLECTGTVCPDGFATCGDGVTARCNVDLMSDDQNCGACGNACIQYNALSLGSKCSGGVCQPYCTSIDLRDCNGIIDDGCETLVQSDPNNCGACGNKCPPGEPCSYGQCGCPAGTVKCGDKCVDTDNDNANCGACGNECPDVAPCGDGPLPFKTAVKCAHGKCGQFVCQGGYDDCNGDLKKKGCASDGCEVETRVDTNNCGFCGNKCAPGQVCGSVGSGIRQCLCGPGETVCGRVSDPDAVLDCVNLETDPRNCGACGHKCPTKPNADAVCRKGVCGFACPPNRADCNGDWSDGCEVDLLTNMNHCGACGNACDGDAGQPCINGACLMTECDAGGGPH